jgi:hypothetical protein
VITAAVLMGVWGWWRSRKSGRPVMLTRAQSTTRVRQLRARGYKVQTMRLKDGTTVVLRSRRPLASRG